MAFALRFNYAQKYNTVLPLICSRWIVNMTITQISTHTHFHPFYIWPLLWGVHQIEKLLSSGLLKMLKKTPLNRRHKKNFHTKGMQETMTRSLARLQTQTAHNLTHSKTPPWAHVYIREPWFPFFHSSNLTESPSMLLYIYFFSFLMASAFNHFGIKQNF